MRQRIGILLLLYLKFWAKLQLKKYAPDIIGITGSAGKTSARDAVAVILSSKYKTKVSHKANSESGIPLDILGLQIKDYSLSDWLRVLLLAPWRVITWWQGFEKYVVEMGIDSPKFPKNMEYLLSIVRPRTGIILNALAVHGESFDYLVKTKIKSKRMDEIRQLIADEKSKLIKSLPENGLAIINADDPAVMAACSQLVAPVRYYGWNQAEALIPVKHLDVAITEAHQSLQGSRFIYAINDSLVELSFPQLLLPSHYAETFAAAFCVGLDEDFTPDEIAALLEANYVLPPGRSTLIAGKKGSVIIDSSYNSSTKPALDMIDLLKNLQPGKAIAIMGDMREMGQSAKHGHELVAEKLLECCDRVLLVGPLMKQYALPILTQSSTVKASWHPNADDAAHALLKELRVGDAVLIKGSQNTLFLESAVEKLMRHPEKAEQLLCRRGDYWNVRRKQAGLTS